MVHRIVWYSIVYKSYCWHGFNKWKSDFKTKVPNGEVSWKAMLMFWVLVEVEIRVW